MIPSSSSSGGSSSNPDPIPIELAPNWGAEKEVDGTAEPTSKDMKGMLGFADRGGWNGAVGSRLCWAAVPGFPPEGKTTGGTLNSFDIMEDRVR